MPDSSTADPLHPEIFDFTRSIPPLPTIMQAKLAATLREMAADGNMALLTRSAAAGGTERDRLAAATWLAPRFGAAPPLARLVVTSGTQSALLLLLESLVGKDGLLLAESLSWGVVAEIARRAHVRLKGIAIDADGIIPEAFEQACKAERPRALYCNPTNQNPTTAIMPEERRRAIAGIARHYNVPIIEDDALGRLHPEAPRPIAALAPDITWYVMALTKCLAHGLRLAYVVGPSPEVIEHVIGPARRLSFWSPAPLSAEVATRWIGEGTAEDILNSIRAETAARARLAQDILKGADIQAKTGGMHLWLTLPKGTYRHDFIRDLKAKGVLARPSELFAVDDGPLPEAVRLSLSSPLERRMVERGLAIIATTLDLPTIPPRRQT